MRIANVDGRLSLIHGGVAIDVAKATNQRFGPDPQAVYDRWEEFRAWARTLHPESLEGASFAPEQLGPPVPRPPQIFAIGLNYDAHARESGFLRPSVPVVFTKYVSSLSGPISTVTLPTETVDWEVELVVVIGRLARDVPAATAWDHVAGLTAGQDISERTSQHAGPAPQFGLAKSFAGFSPVGPVVATPDEFDDPDDVELGCSVDGTSVQEGRTSSMIFSVPELVAHLSSVVTLLPGDLIFTGTPAGVGAGRTPPRYLRPGEVLLSHISGIGELRQTFVAREH